jgi:hypothetical protein
LYDYDLHMRFVRSMTDAWFNYATAGFAAYGAMQNHISNQLDETPAPEPAAPASPYEQALTWWTDIFLPQTTKPAAKPAMTPIDFVAPFFQFAPMQSSHNAFDLGAMMNPFNAFGATAATAMPNAWTSGMVEMMTAYSRTFPQFSWSIMHGPMTAWLMAIGLPYTVAAPAARGNAASMDAAAAAREGFDRMCASFRSDGGHAVAPILGLPAMDMMLAPYWTSSPKRLH